MAIMIGTNTVSDLFVGANNVTELWLGTDLAFEKRQYVWTLFDSGQIEGIPWGRNKFPRTGGTGSVSSALESVAMHAYCNATGEATAKSNCHFNTSNPIEIPRTASTLCVSARYLNGSTSILFGMLPANAENSQSTKNGGFLSGTLTLTSSYATYSINIPDALKGAENMYIVINCIIKLDSRRDVYVRKVWFE